jgi:putative flippase GtrA
MTRVVESIEAFLARAVPDALKKYFHIGFKWGIFVTGGLIGYLIYYFVYRLASDHGITLGISLASGLVPAIVFTFLYHSFITFDEKAGWKARFVKFVPIQVAISALNWVVTRFTLSHFNFPDLVIGRFRFPDLPATFVITFLISILNFSITRLIFKRK